MKAQRRALQGESGLTLVELMISLTVMTVLMGLVGSTLISAMTATNRLQRTQSAVDDAEFFSATLDRELRSAQCISSPGENQSGNVLTFLTLVNSAQATVTYRVSAGKVTRQVDVQPEYVLITNVGTTTSAFHQYVTPLRTVQVSIPIVSANGGSFQLQTTIAGRNAWRTC